MKVNVYDYSSGTQTAIELDTLNMGATIDWWLARHPRPWRVTGPHPDSFKKPFYHLVDASNTLVHYALATEPQEVAKLYILYEFSKL